MRADLDFSAAVWNRNGIFGNDSEKDTDIGEEESELKQEIVICAPLEGTVLPIEKVGDGVFAEKILGEGCAIRPSEGKVYAPIDGEITSVAQTKHAWGIRSEEGVELLIHFGLETVSLQGEGFTAFVKVGDRVRRGDLMATVDLELLRSKGIEPTTPIVITDLPEGGRIEPFPLREEPASKVQVGDPLMRVVCSCEASASAAASASSPDSPDLPRNENRGAGEAKKPPTSAPTPPSKGKRGIFDFFQKLGKVLMTVIAVMPAAGLAISIGKLIAMTGDEIAILATVGGVIENIGWAIISNLHILFAVAIGGSWAKERAGGAFAALLAFILINNITGAVFGVTSAMLSDPAATVTSLWGQKMEVSTYFTSVLGAPALNMGVFVGIIAGFVGGAVYNKFYNFRKLPNALSFFNGKRFVPLAVIFYASATSLVLALVWPLVQSGINAFGVWIANSADSSPLLAPFIYGTLERLLLPFGLHHMLTIPMNYTSFGGSYTILTGTNAGEVVFGQDPLWLAWVTDLIGFKNAGDTASYTALLESVTPARFKIGQMIGSTGLLLGIALAMYRRVDPDKRKAYRSMFFSASLAVFLTGVTEPLEFMFMFCAIPLYIVYALLQGCAFALSGVIDLRLHSFGSIELLTRIPMSLQAGLLRDLFNFLLASLIFFAIGYGVAHWMIGKFRYATPGRLGNYTADTDGSTDGSTNGAASAASANSPSADSQPARIIALLGGKDNIVLVDACMTRLRVTVKEPSLVASVEQWKAEGALGVIQKGTGVQAVYGPKADLIKSDINDLLGRE